VSGDVPGCNEQRQCRGAAFAKGACTVGTRDATARVRSNRRRGPRAAN
jgi:hypothetical protein